MKLAEIQKQFANHIYNKDNDLVFQYIAESSILKKDRMQSYRNNVFASFKRVLKSIYTTVYKIVGDEYFNRISQQYIKKYHSNSGNLDIYGSKFPTFINSLLQEHKLSYLYDISKLELYYHKSYFHRNVKQINLAKLQSLSEDEYCNCFI